jgi:hypothetical protein
MAMVIPGNLAANQCTEKALVLKKMSGDQNNTF